MLALRRRRRARARPVVIAALVRGFPPRFARLPLLPPLAAFASRGGDPSINGCLPTPRLRRGVGPRHLSLGRLAALALDAAVRAG